MFQIFTFETQSLGSRNRAPVNRLRIRPQVVISCFKLRHTSPHELIPIMKKGYGILKRMAFSILA